MAIATAIPSIVHSQRIKTHCYTVVDSCYTLAWPEVVGTDSQWHYSDRCYHPISWHIERHYVHYSPYIYQWQWYSDCINNWSDISNFRKRTVRHCTPWSYREDHPHNPSWDARMIRPRKHHIRPKPVSFLPIGHDTTVVMMMMMMMMMPDGRFVRPRVMSGSCPGVYKTPVRRESRPEADRPIPCRDPKNSILFRHPLYGSVMDDVPFDRR